jgi:polyhydroxyalkanoate synthesis repressor PhaR
MTQRVILLLTAYDAPRHTARRMAYIIKRYANRKLYDTQSKRYLTLDEVAVLVRIGEEVSVVDAETGEDLTASVLSKIVAEGARRTGESLPRKLLVELIQRPGEAMVDAVRHSMEAGQRTVEQMSGEVNRLITSIRGREATPSAPPGDERIVQAIDERLRAVLAELGLPTRGEIQALSNRVAELERVLAPKDSPAPKRRGSKSKKNEA